MIIRLRMLLGQRSLLLHAPEDGSTASAVVYCIRFCSYDVLGDIATSFCSVVRHNWKSGCSSSFGLITQIDWPS